MRSKTILAAALAGALAAPLAALAEDNNSNADSSYGSRSPSASANVGGASVQGSLGSSDRSAGTYGQQRDDQYAQNEDHDKDKHRGRDKRHRDRDKDDNASYNSQDQGSNSRYPSQNSQSSQYPSQSNQQYSSKSQY